MRCHRRTRLAAALAGLVLAAVAPAVPAGAAVLRVGSTADAVDARPGDGICRSQAGRCTLRAAVQEANALPGPDTVQVPAGVYALALPGVGVNPVSNGDLDVLAPIAIVGAGTGATVLDGGSPPTGSPPERRGLDRLFEIHPGAGDVSLSALTIRDGYSTTTGGGIRTASGGTLRLQDVHIANSFAATGGGAVASSGQGRLQITGSLLAGNATGGYGGGVLDTGSGPAEIVNSTLSGNRAQRSGGGVRSTATAPLRVVSSTLFGNTAAAGGAVSHLAGRPAALLVLRNTIAAGGCAGAIASEGGNIDSGRSCALAAPGDRSGADPLLAPLAANGGRTSSHAPRAGSPAIDGGVSPCPAADQRGAPRPQGLRCDSGAVEAPPSAALCATTNATVAATADAWIDQGSPSANKGADATLRLKADALAAARVLVTFRLPRVLPGCVVDSARMRLFAPSGEEDSRLEAARAATAWQEQAVTWSNQPRTTGGAATAHSGEGYLSWDVAAHVQAMLGGAPNHGFLIKDADELADDGGDTELHSREKGEAPPVLVLRFAPPITGSPPAPAPPQPAVVTCGQELTRSTKVMNDLTDCPTADGLVIGAHRIIVDLNGHTIDGVGLGTGIRNDGYHSVTIANGRVREWDHGVQLQAGTRGGAVRNVTAAGNEVTGIQLWAATGVEIRANAVAENGDGIALLAGSADAVVAGNTLTANRGAHLLAKDARGGRIEGNTATGGGDLGIELLRSTGIALVANRLEGTSDSGIIVDASQGNRVEANVLTGTGDSGILVDASRQTVVAGNRVSGMSGSGDSGILVDASRQTVVAGNRVSGMSDNGIELGDGSVGNAVTGNTATANGNDGIRTEDGGNTLTANVGNGNGGWGISAAAGTIDGGGNRAAGNGETGQCTGVRCSS